MTTKKHSVTGELYWAKVFEENRDLNGFEGQAIPFEGVYKIDVRLDKENKALVKASGTALKGRFDDDGNYSVCFKRKHKDRFDWASGAPKVFKPDGTEWVFEDDGVIPNGSEGRIDFSVYTTSMTPGTRLEVVYVSKKAAMEPKEEAAKAVPVDTHGKEIIKGKYDLEVPF